MTCFFDLLFSWCLPLLKSFNGLFTETDFVAQVSGFADFIWGHQLWHHRGILHHGQLSGGHEPLHATAAGTGRVPTCGAARVVKVSTPGKTVGQLLDVDVDILMRIWS